MSFTAYMLDVVSDTIYPARITIEDGIFKEVTPITVSEKEIVIFFLLCYNKTISKRNGENLMLM